MKITILSHKLYSNAAMRAHRLAKAASLFADVTMVGLAKAQGVWPALPREPWLKTVPEKDFPKFYDSLVELVEAADGDVLIAVKPYLASFGAGLLAAERRQVPLILDIDDLDVALAPLAAETRKPARTDLDRPDSEIYLALLTRAAPAASAITVASSALQKRFGGTLVPHGSLTDLFDPAVIDREAARRLYEFTGPTVLFPGTPRKHKGIRPLAKAVAKVAGARLAVLCRPEDMALPEWERCEVQKIPLVPYTSLPTLLAAADVVAIPQLDKAPSRYQMPMKVYDCMAMGKPIVASSISDLPATLDGCASLVPPGDVKLLAAAIADLLQNPAKGRALGEKARARCLERFSMPIISQSLHAVVAPLLDRK